MYHKILIDNLAEAIISKVSWCVYCGKSQNDQNDSYLRTFYARDRGAEVLDAEVTPEVLTLHAHIFMGCETQNPMSWSFLEPGGLENAVKWLNDRSIPVTMEELLGEKT